MNSFLRRIPRPSLLWMSVDEVVRVRNAIIGLYLGPGEVIEMGEPLDMMNMREAMVKFVCHKLKAQLEMNASTPVITWGDNLEHKTWLKLSDSIPYWDYQYSNYGPIERLAFNAPKARAAAILIRSWKTHFPFKPTDNYLVNGGQPIA